MVWFILYKNHFALIGLFLLNSMLKSRTVNSINIPLKKQTKDLGQKTKRATRLDVLVLFIFHWNSDINVGWLWLKNEVKVRRAETLFAAFRQEMVHATDRSKLLSSFPIFFKQILELLVKTEIAHLWYIYLHLQQIGSNLTIHCTVL